MVALSGVVASWRLRRRLSVKGNRACSVTGGCVVGSCRVLSPLGGCGAVLMYIAIDLAPLEGLVVALSCRVLSGVVKMLRSRDF